MKKFLGILGVLAFLFIVWYSAMPVMNLRFWGPYWIVIMLFVVIGVTVGNWNELTDSRRFSGYGSSKISVEKDNYLSYTFFGLAAISVVMLLFVAWFTTGAIFHADEYKALIGSPKERVITADMSPTSPENIIIIDKQTAQRLADKKISDEDRALGSQVVLGEITLQKVKDKMYYVIPLLHTDFFKYWKNGDNGTPGYIMVNATNDKDVKFVREIGGKPLHIVYQPEACFFRNLQRHIYTSGYSTVGFEDPCFEIDDNGKPFYVYTLYEKTIGMSGKNTVGALVVDVETGVITSYTDKDIPEWVDRIQPESIISSQIDDWGYYVNGWLNPSDKDRLTLSGEMVLVYGDNGKCYYYAGLTSVGKDNSSIGFLLVDSKTKEVFYYKQVGATEEGAMTSAEGKWQEKGYKATCPRPYNIDGVWTYVMALKDNEGLVKAVAMVSVANYETVGVGETIKDALRSYKSALNGTGNTLVTGKLETEKELTAIITRISMDLKQGNSYYYFTVDSLKDKMFVASSDVSEKIILSKVGDKIKVGFDENGAGVIDVREFDNLNLILTRSIEQVKADSDFKQLKDSVKTSQNNHDVNAKWDNLSVEEKKKAIEKLKK